MTNPFYFDNTGQRRKNAIYAPVIDRFLLVDDNDINITFQTANVLSSKIATTVYATPYDTNGMTNDNCMAYKIFDKSGATKSGVPILMFGQIPTTRIINNPQQFTYDGIVSDDADPGLTSALVKLKAYTEYVHEHMTMIHLMSLYGADNDTKTFADEFFEEDIIGNKVTAYDNGINSLGVLRQIKRVLYVSDSVEEANNEIEDIWRRSGTLKLKLIYDSIKREFK